MNSQKIIFNIIIIILFLSQILCLILYSIKYPTIYEYKNFMNLLYRKTNYDKNSPYVLGFEKVFGHYCNPPSMVCVDLNEIKSLVIYAFNIITGFFLISGVIYFCIFSLSNRSKGDLKCFKIICPLIFAFGGLTNIYIIYIAFSEGKIVIPNDQFYIFDDEFNETIRNTLNFVSERGSYLQWTSILIIITIIIQIFITVVYSLKLEFKYIDNYNVEQNISHPQNSALLNNNIENIPNNN